VNNVTGRDMSRVPSVVRRRALLESSVLSGSGEDCNRIRRSK
jgi:hypothetical protein